MMESFENYEYLGENGEFTLLQPEVLSKMWGKFKNNPGMNYSKLSRSLRYYYTRDIIQKVNGKRYSYKFNFPAIMFNIVNIDNITDKRLLVTDIMRMNDSKQGHLHHNCCPQCQLTSQSFTESKENINFYKPPSQCEILQQESLHNRMVPQLIEPISSDITKFVEVFHPEPTIPIITPLKSNHFYTLYPFVLNQKNEFNH